jgi:two-component system, OmpR family, response regulator BaeR
MPICPGPVEHAYAARMPASILIVEDEAKLATLLADYLAQAGFATRCLADGRNVARTVRASAPDLILLDLVLPGRDGIAICRELRSFTTTPVVMISARNSESDRLRGIEQGADDYICKPFSPREVVARVRAILRRCGRFAPDVATALAIDPACFKAVLDGVPLALTPAEFRLLHALAERPGVTLSRNELRSRLYVDYRVVEDRTVDGHVKTLRYKLRRVRKHGDIVRTTHGVGYRLEL